MPTSSGAHGQRGGPSSPPSPLAPEWRWRRVFPGHERELSALRRWLSELLPDCSARDDVLSVATELGSNAIQHTQSGRGGWFAVDITWHGPVVRVAVADGGAPAGPRVVDDPDGEHGRGLLVVEGLSARTGMYGDHRGRLVWADVPWGDAGAATPASPQDPFEAVIGDGKAGLAGRFAGVPAWFGRSTLQWWALAGGELMAAPSAEELASLISRALDAGPSWPAAAGDTAFADARAARAAGRGQRPGFLASRSRPGRARLPRPRVTGPEPAGVIAHVCRPEFWAGRRGLAGALANCSGLPAAAGSSGRPALGGSAC